MKFFAVAAAATLAVVSAADPCSLTALAPVATTPAATGCQADSGYSILKPSYPDDTTLGKMCASDSCKSLLAALKAAAPNECMVTLVTPNLALYADLLTPIQAACDKLSAPSSAPTSAPTAAPTTSPGDTPTVAPSDSPSATPAPSAC